VKLFHAETATEETYQELVSLLRNGGVIAFPTDTAYGLGADPFNESGVRRIFQLKGRPETKPILLLVDSLAMAENVIQPGDLFQIVAGTFWPGPLTVITRAAASVPANVTAGSGTIALRWPMTPFATTLVSRLGGPITATSANRRGMPSSVSADEVREQFGDSLEALVDGGQLPSRGGSTLLDLTLDPPVVIRQGPVSFERLSKFFKGRIRRQVA
jgi:L-threonylcarbamoyladenylate synthase